MTVAAGGVYAATHPTAIPEYKLESSYGIMYHEPVYRENPLKRKLETQPMLPALSERDEHYVYDVVQWPLKRPVYSVIAHPHYT